MKTNCTFKGCTNKVIITCRCTKIALYYCQEHFNHHSLKEEANPLLLELPSVSQIIHEIAQILGNTEKLKANLMERTNFLISLVTVESKKSFQAITILESKLLDLSKSLLRGNTYDINKELAKIKSPVMRSVCVFYPLVTKLLTGFFEIAFDEADSDCNEVIFSNDQETCNLMSIALDNFTVSALAYAPKIGAWGSACRITKNVYFVCGGYKKKPVGETFIINTKTLSFEILPHRRPICNSACVYYNFTIHAFGGYIKSKPTNLCYAFDIKSQVWSTSEQLPQPFGHNTAAVLNKGIIIVTGLQSNKLYAYDKSAFFPVLNLSFNDYKVICERWIVTAAQLFENHDCITNWVSYKISWDPTYLCIYTTFRKNKYIYFIDSRYKLWRLDTESKVIEILKYK